MTSWEIGRKLDNGKYIVDRELGRGAFGITYKVRETRTDRLFAVKTLNESLQQRTDFPAIQVKFINEAIRLAKCSHPNIADVTEVFMEDQLWCMVMEYIDGIELANYLGQKGTLSETEAINIIDRVGLALSCVHEKNILHRDIKPENILLRKSDLSPVLVDFGLAREIVPNLTLQSMSHFGTLFYAPIEEYEQKGNFGAWTDIYALAATLYVLLVGRAKTPSQLSTIRKIEYLANKRDSLPTPKQINSDISDRTNEAILKGMAIEPGDRPKIVQDWLNLLPPNQKETYYLSIRRGSREYHVLQDFLAHGIWKAADEETQKLMFGESFGLMDGGGNAFNSMVNLPLSKIKLIDELWTHYSNGRFGFSIQNQIWEKVSANIYDFARTVGWLDKEETRHGSICYGNLEFKISAPIGHLPCFVGNFYPSGDTLCPYFSREQENWGNWESWNPDDDTYIFLCDFGTNYPYFEGISNERLEVRGLEQRLLFLQQQSRIHVDWEKLKDSLEKGESLNYYIDNILYLDVFFERVKNCYK